MTVETYLDQLPDDRKEPMTQLVNLFRQHLPAGFKECISYGMISFAVPHDRYPAGYHCNPAEPLPFLSMASQKNNISLYHMGLYMDGPLCTWFQEEYAKRVPTKLDMGKSCIRFKKPALIPYDLLAELAQKITVDEWIMRYEAVLNRNKK
jgi:uncharacterized protein YdhG (YjbR/CyaY superfamily)